MRKIKHPEVHVGLSGEDGSAYVILGRVTKALRLAVFLPKDYGSEGFPRHGEQCILTSHCR